MTRPRDSGSPATTVLVVLGLVAAGAAGIGCQSVVVATRSTDGFVALPDEPRVSHEPGAERRARVIAAALPPAIGQVETAQDGGFGVPIRIYVCATIESYARFTGGEKSGGHTTIARKIFISPKPENTEPRLPRVLTHELSHLHLGQRLGLYRRSALPTWFTEGLAVFVSGGGGAENVTEADAAAAIRAGQSLTPNDTRAFFTHDTAARFGLPPHMFYRQASMFVAYLKQRDAPAFRRLLTETESGTTFKNGFEEAYRTDLASAWRAFVGQLPSGSPTRDAP